VSDVIPASELLCNFFGYIFIIYFVCAFPESIDVTSFRNYHSDACRKLEALCDIWEKKMAELEESDGSKEEGLLLKHVKYSQ